MKTRMRCLAIVLSLAMIIGSLTIAFADSDEQQIQSQFEMRDSKYEKPDINSLTGHGSEPEEISVSAGAKYAEKEWYEYVVYSDNAVASYRLNDDSRILFYDPYTYNNAMVMDVQFDAKTTDFDTMSSYTISHTSSRTITGATESTTTSTSATQTSGKDVTYSNIKNTGKDTTTNTHTVTNTKSGKVVDTERTDYDYKIIETYDFSAHAEIGTKGVEITSNVGDQGTWKKNVVTDHTTKTHTTDYIGYEDKTTYKDDGSIEYASSSETDGWSQLAARVTRTVGSSASVNTGWSEEEGTTVTKTYEATHFASDGVTPLPWAIVHYSVQMPMKTALQYKVDGEWVTVSTVYCMLTTIQGTCRAWIQNGQTYYEDWGNGEPVVATDFWAQFMTKDQLMKAYQDKLYPTGGVNNEDN